MSQNEKRDMSHVTRFVVSHKYSFGMIEHLLTKNMRYIDKSFSSEILVSPMSCLIFKV
jgi:hypothetical protein